MHIKNVDMSCLTVLSSCVYHADENESQQPVCMTEFQTTVGVLASKSQKLGGFVEYQT